MSSSQRTAAVVAWALAALSGSGCGSSSPTGLLQVFGRDIGSDYANVSVVSDGDGEPINDAHFLVNGDVIPPSVTEGGLYSGPFAVSAVNGAIHLEVTSGGRTVVGDGTSPAAPTLTAPADSARYAAGEDVVVTWTSPSPPDRFLVTAQWSCGSGCGNGVEIPAGPSDSRAVIPARDLPTAKDVTISVFAYNDGMLAGDYAPSTPSGFHPGMNIRAESEQVTIHCAVP